MSAFPPTKTFKELVSAALSRDSNGDSEGAYIIYNEALRELLAISPVPTSHFEIHEAFELARSCLSRMLEISKTIPKSSDSMDEDSDYLSVASPSRHTSIEGTPAKIPGASLTAPTPLISTASSLQNSPAKCAERNLSQVRRLHEQQMVAKQKERSQSLAMARRPSSRNDHYVSSILERRSARPHLSISEIFDKAADLPNSLRSAIAHSERRRSIRYALVEAGSEKDIIVIKPLISIFSAGNETLGGFLRQFLTRCRHLLRSAYSEPNPANINRTIINEIGIVEYHLVEQLQENFEDLRSERLIVSLKHTIQSFLFSTALGPLLLSQLRREYATVEQTLSSSISEMAWEGLLGRLHIPPKHRLPPSISDVFAIHDSGIYSSAVQMLSNLSAHSSPVDKLICLTEVCNEICNAVSRHRSREMEEDCADDQPAIGSEDLLPLTAYVIVRAAVPNLYSQIALISELIPEEIVKGESGYVLATFQAAMDYIISCRPL